MIVTPSVQQPIEPVFLAELAAELRRGVRAAGYIEAEHPRDPGGEGGGRWIKKGTSAADGWDAKVDDAFDNAVVEPIIDPEREFIENAESMWRQNYDLESEKGWSPNVAQAAARDGFADPADWVAELELRAKEALAYSDLKIRTPLSAALMVVEDGRFKSQFETGTSNGTFNPGYRATFERKAFGLPGVPRGTPTSWERRYETQQALLGNAAWLHERPIYGYLEGPNIHARDAHFYGEVEWVLKPEVKGRATFTARDSLGGMLVPSAVNNPSHLSLSPPWGGRAGEDVRDNPTETSLRYPVAVEGYAEAQIHRGGVSLEDVAAVYFPSGFELSDAMEDKLRRAGMAVYIGETRWR